MAQKGIVLSGDKELARALLGLELKVQKKVVRKGLRVAGKIALGAAKRHAASRDRGGGEMIKLSRKLKLRAAKRSRRGFGVRVLTPKKSELDIPEGADYYWPAHVELGTSKTPPLPYLRPAFDENKEKMLAAFAKEVRKGIDEVWRRGR